VRAVQRACYDTKKRKGPACSGPFSFVRPAGRTFLEVKVLYGPDTGNR
jgi:hypothetical protein